MNRILIAAAAAATTLAASPVLAGQPVTDLEIRQHFAADETGNEAWIYAGEEMGVTDRAAMIHAEIAAEDESDNRATDLTAASLEMSERGVASDKAAMILMQIEAEERGKI